MNFKNKKLKAIADRILIRAVKLGFKKNEIEDCYTENLLKETTSPRIKDFIELSYYKGIFKGFQYCESLINGILKQKHTKTANELEKQNEELIKRLEKLDNIVLSIKKPPKNTGKLIKDGRSFVAYRNENTKKVSEAIRTASENKKFLEKIKIK